MPVSACFRSVVIALLLGPGLAAQIAPGPTPTAGDGVTSGGRVHIYQRPAPLGEISLGLLQIDGDGSDKYLASQSPDDIGHGFDYDPFTNTWMKKKPVLYLTTPLVQTQESANETIKTVSNFSEADSFDSSQTSFSIEAAYGLFSAAASLSFSSTSSSSSSSDSFSVVWDKDYGFVKANLGEPTGWMFTPEAQAVIDLAQMYEGDPAMLAMVTDMWIEKFGRFVATATAPRPVSRWK